MARPQGINIEGILKGQHLILAGKANIATIRFLTERIKEIEKAVLAEAKLRDEYKYILTAPEIMRSKKRKVGSALEN